MKKILINESQLDKLFEYHAQQRLPFKDEYGKKDYEFADKNMAEEYLDWIEEFGKVGELDRSSFNFEAGFKSGLGTAFEWFKKNNSNIDELYMKSRFTNNLKKHGFIVINKDKSISTECKFNDKGNMYVERIVTLDSELNEPSAGSFEKFVEKYNNNVGGCWCWQYGRSADYCSNNNGSKILLRGWIRLDDIDWVETVYINSYGMNAECEIRVKPNAKVELFEIYGSFFNSDPYYDDENDRFSSYGNGDEDIPLYKFNLGGRHIIVTATYFGNNVNFDKFGFAEIYDSTSNEKKFMDRKGNIINSQKELIMKKIDYLRNNDNMSYRDIFNSVKEVRGSEFLLCNDYGKWFILNDADDSLVGGMIFDSIDIRTFSDYEVFRVMLSDNSNEYMSDYKVNYIKMDGKYMFKDWYDSIFSIDGRTFFVELDGKWGLYNSGEINFIYSDVNRLYSCDDSKLRKYYIEVKYDGKYNLYDITDNRFVTKYWFNRGYWVNDLDGVGNVIVSEDDNGDEIYINLLNGKIMNREDLGFI